MRKFDSDLPIDAALPELTGTLRVRNCAVLVAPPGAGKTTRVPLVLADEEWAHNKKILVLEPRRLAARAATAHMAATLDERVGDTVGLRVRFGSKVSRRTRIEVVTEGIFTRMILDDPGLSGVAAVLFDEFHERSLDADLGLALARDVQTGLRDDLKILVMSATLDGARVAKLLGGAPVIESQGRAFPVETRYRGRDARLGIERQIADAVTRALAADSGSVLVFLPGAAEIRRTQTLLRDRIADSTVDVVALFGALDTREQDRAIEPAPPGRRKIVLATSIAETSLTIEGVRIVVDSGLARVPRYEPDVGVTRLETVRVSRAAADQRRGRAGRTEPGICYRLWDEPQTASLEPYTRPEILSADLSGFTLDLAQWGVIDSGKLAFLDPPPHVAFTEAKTLLIDLGAVDAAGRITVEGRKLRALPLPPRLARMVVDAAGEGEGVRAAEIAAILTERGLGGDDPDLAHRLDGFHRDRSLRAEDARRMAKRWAGGATTSSPSPLGGAPHRALRDGNPSGEGRGGGSMRAIPPSRTASRSDLPRKGGGKNNKKQRDGDISVGATLARAYPDRIAKNRGSGSGAFLLANGRGANVDPASALAREPYLAVAELAGSAAQGRVVLAAKIALAEIEAYFAARIEEREDVVFDAANAGLRARRLRRLGALALAERPLLLKPDADTARVLAQGLAQLGIGRLPWTKPLRQWRDRIMFLRRAEGEEWPDLSDAALTTTITDWLPPVLMDKTALAQLSADDLESALHARVPWNLRRRLETEAPTHFEAPTGTRVAIDYEAEEGPKIAIRVQELFGLDRHPAIAAGKMPLILELLSPAHRPVQVTRDLPGFWRGSYAAVRVEMKGRYPRHPWPDDPIATPATRRAKPRGR